MTMARLSHPNPPDRSAFPTTASSSPTPTEDSEERTQRKMGAAAEFEEGWPRSRGKTWDEESSSRSSKDCAKNSVSPGLAISAAEDSFWVTVVGIGYDDPDALSGAHRMVSAPTALRQTAQHLRRPRRNDPPAGLTNPSPRRPALGPATRAPVSRGFAPVVRTPPMPMTSQIAPMTGPEDSRSEHRDDRPAPMTG